MLGTAGRSTVRNVGGSSKPVKADPGDEGFCPRRRKNNLCYRSFITRYISFWSCWNVWNWCSIHQLSVLFADRKVAFFTILPLFRAERWWRTSLSSVKIFGVRFKLSRSVAAKRLFALHANGLSLAPKTNTKYYQKDSSPKTFQHLSHFFLLSNRKPLFLPQSSIFNWHLPIPDRVQRNVCCLQCHFTNFFSPLSNPQRGFSVICIHWKCHFNYLELL